MRKGSVLRIAALSVMLAAACGTGVRQAQAEASPTGVPNYQYTLEQVGSFEGERDSISFYRSSSTSYACAEKDGGRQLLANDGSFLMDGAVFSNVEYLGNGLYGATLKDGDETSTGIVSVDGKVLVPFDVVMILKSWNNPQGYRFVEVLHSDGKASNKEEAFFSIDSSGTVSFSPREGAAMYKGHTHVFDLKKGAYVDEKNIKITTAYVDTFTDMGDAFAIKRDNKVTLYDENGKELWSGEGHIRADANGLRYSKDGKTQIIDKTGKERFVTEKSLASCVGGVAPLWAGEYVLEEEGDSGSNYAVIDFDGERVTKETYQDEPRFCNGLFSVKRTKESKTYAIIDSKGNKLTESASGESQPIMKGYNYVRLEDDATSIVKGESVIATGDYDSDDARGLVCEDGGKLLVLNEGKFSLGLENANCLDVGLASGRGGKSMGYGVYDLFTGKQLLKDEYDYVNSGGGRVYAYKNGTWTVYEPKLQEL